MVLPATASRTLSRLPDDQATIAACGRDSSNLNFAGGQQPEPGQAWNKEIIAAPGCDKAGNVKTNEWSPPRRFVAGNHHAPPFMIAGNWIGVIALLEIVAEVDPCLLHELELIKPGIEREEEYAAAFPILFAGRQIFAIRDSAPNQPAPAHRLAAEPKRVARVGTSNVRSERTPRARGILGVGECIAGVFAGSVRVFHQRRSIWPPSHHLGSHEFLRGSAGRQTAGQYPSKRFRLLFKISPKFWHVLFQLAQDEIGRIMSEKVRQRHGCELATLARVTENELTRRNFAKSSPTIGIADVLGPLRAIVAGHSRDVGVG